MLVDFYGLAQQGVGFGLDVATIEDPAAAATLQAVGSNDWSGAFGAWYWVDPANDLVFVGMIQNLRGSVPGAGAPEVRGQSVKLVHDALKR